MSRAIIPLTIIQILLLAFATPFLLVLAWISVSDQGILAMWTAVFGAVFWMISGLVALLDERVPRPGFASLLLTVALLYGFLCLSEQSREDPDHSAIFCVLLYASTVVVVLAGYWVPLWWRARLNTQ
jgi:hypothetical protein